MLTLCENPSKGWFLRLDISWTPGVGRFAAGLGSSISKRGRSRRSHGHFRGERAAGGVMSDNPKLGAKTGRACTF